MHDWHFNNGHNIFLQRPFWLVGSNVATSIHKFNTINLHFLFFLLSRLQYSCRLMQRLFVFVLWHGVGDDAGADLEVIWWSFARRANGDVLLAAAVEAEPADGAGEDAQ